MNIKFEIGYTISVITICLGILFSNFAKNNNELEKPGFVEYHFAFNINPSQNTGIINYAVVGVKDGKISHEHIYWDQASVLVQAGLLDPKGLPVSGADAAEKVLDPSLPSRSVDSFWFS